MRFQFLVIVAIFSTTCQSGPSAQVNNLDPIGEVVVFTNVNVITMEREPPLMGQQANIEQRLAAIAEKYGN